MSRLSDDSLYKFPSFSISLRSRVVAEVLSTLMNRTQPFGSKETEKYDEDLIRLL